MPSSEVEFEGVWGGRWTLDRDDQIGGGAFGRVYLGRSAEGDRIAVKVLTPLPGERDVRERTREIEIAETLRAEDRHYLLRTLDYGFEGEDLCVAMELGSGSLEIPAGGLDEDEAVAVIMQISLGLVELEEFGVVHRDVKPANIILVDGVWKLADFGISRNTAVGTQTVTFSDWGTLTYMAPERFDPGVPASVKTDLYALGCIAYELLVGEAFATGNESEVISAHRTKTPDLPEDLDPTLRATVLSLLQKNPARRPASAQEVVERLQRNGARTTSSGVGGPGVAGSRRSRATSIRRSPK